jgi:uncharacterized protein involved in exopolysaccharide biosynthesis
MIPVQTRSLGEYLVMAQRRKKSMLITAGLVLLLSVLAALFWPSTYRSTATILIEEQEIPQDMVRSTITSYANQQIQIITQRVMTLDNIMAMVEKFEVYDKGELARMPKTSVAKAFEDAVKLDVVNAEVVDPRSGRPTEATIAFSLSFSHHSPRKAQQVTNELVNLYLNENLRTRSEKTASTERFLRQEAEVLNKELIALEDKLADFKGHNKDALPDTFQFNVQNLSRMQAQLQGVQASLREISKREMELSAKLAQTSAYAPTVLASGETVLADVDRLKALQSEYRKKAASYNANHPDIKKLKREIDTLSATVGHSGDQDELRRLLQERQAELVQLQQTYAADHPDVIAKKRLIEQLQAQLAMAQSGSPSANPDNPTYIFLENQLSALQMEKAGLQQQAQSLGAQVEELNQAVLMAPAIEKQYLQLQRTLQTTQAKYLDLRTKLREAELAGALEQGRKGQRFTLIEPATLPQQPVSPNRLALLMVGIILAGAAGAGMMILLETLDQSIRSEKTLAAAAGAPPLVSIGYIRTPEEQAKNKPDQRLYIYGGIVLATLLIALLAINFLYKPLDVLWYVLLRKLGIG